jgi:hypothetical protein
LALKTTQTPSPAKKKKLYKAKGHPLIADGLLLLFILVD